MDHRQAIVLGAFLSEVEAEQRESLLSFLSPKAQEELQEDLQTIPSHPQEETAGAGDLIDQVHWSWFLPTLKSQEEPLLLLALPAVTRQNLAQELKMDLPQESITETARLFFRSLLLQSLLGHENGLLPREYLPASPLNPLLSLSKKELIQLIDHLALYDLANELRQIVETKILKKIYSFLREDEKSILKALRTRKEPFSFTKMGLDKWDGTEEMLRSMLHRRGIARLGAALSGQEPDLIWYICHQLDIGRGSALHKFCMKEPMADLTNWMIKEVETFIKGRR